MTTTTAGICIVVMTHHADRIPWIMDHGIILESWNRCACGCGAGGIKLSPAHCIRGSQIRLLRHVDTLQNH
jgi:hypothetical protein